MHSKLLPLTSRNGDSRLGDELAEDVVFHSPVRDYRGRADVSHILMTIGAVLDELEGQREFVAEREAVTIITAAHDQRRMSGVLHETYDADGRLEQVTLLLRPLSALLGAITAMRAALERSPLPSTATDRAA